LAKYRSEIKVAGPFQLIWKKTSYRPEGLLRNEPAFSDLQAAIHEKGVHVFSDHGNPKVA
jgi:hypothetical protein